MKFRNLKIRNLKIRIMKTWNMKFQNLKISNLKIWNLKVWNLKIWNWKVWNLKIWNLKIRNLKIPSLKFRIWVGGGGWLENVILMKTQSSTSTWTSDLGLRLRVCQKLKRHYYHTMTIKTLNHQNILDLIRNQFQFLMIKENKN